MKHLKEFISIILAFSTIGLTLVGCDKNETPEGTNKVVENISTAPDYANSTKSLNMYAYVGPTPGWYTDENGNRVTTQDFRTEERYQEYKDCGFDTLLLLGNDGYVGEPYATSSLKKNLDLCAKVGLKCIVMDVRIHDLSTMKNSLIGNGVNQYKDMDALTKKVRALISDYYDHPAFYGLELVDEPSHLQFTAVGEVYKAIKTINEERVKEGKNALYLNSVMLPYATGANYDALYTPDSASTGKKAYREYITRFFSKTDSDYFDYDCYPFIRSMVGGADVANSSYIFPNYFANLQMVAEETNKLGKDFYLTMQSHSSTLNAANSTGRREMKIEDFRYQLHSAFSFGAKDLRYYTYWTFPNHTNDPMSNAIMSDTGEKQYYDMVQTVNLEAKAMAKVMLHYDYKKTALGYDLYDYPTHFSGVKDSETLEGITFTTTCGTIFNEMYDADNGYTGYYVFNAEDPAANKTATVEIKFDNFKYAAVYENGKRTLYELNNGSYYATLEKGEGVFVIPFN